MCSLTIKCVLLLLNVWAATAAGSSMPLRELSSDNSKRTHSIATSSMPLRELSSETDARGTDGVGTISQKSAHRDFGV